MLCCPHITPIVRVPVCKVHIVTVRYKMWIQCKLKTHPVKPIQYVVQPVSYTPDIVNLLPLKVDDRLNTKHHPWCLVLYNTFITLSSAYIPCKTDFTSKRYRILWWLTLWIFYTRFDKLNFYWLNITDNWEFGLFIADF